ncbi:MAG: ABC transporter substrate-binding protein [Proteobacteria bacterium]|nr:ABC transporter substrate-binding protein [Pseudomonadota bacterium]MBU1449402.1 ABC transporter substrate-binding protein [Pseudomonadota bacterium]MBU2470544.1 ABC transporter substrate-binding protein [Pseudomonadota bacterium]MBU2519584.1 ABC transporter substrate-binding protein [Pseudomonadota bacterium]
MQFLGRVGAVLLGLSLILAMCLPAGAADPITIGVLGPMSFTQGEGHWNGATMAADEINQAGGVKVGNVMRPIKLIKIDTNEFLSIPDATNAVEMAVSRYKVDFLIGGFRTEAVQVMQDIAMDAKKIFIGCGAAHPALCTRVTKDYDRYKYWFRLTPINSSYLGKVDFILLGTVGAIMKAQLGLDKIKVAVVAEKAAWADPIVRAAQKVLPGKMGMEVVGVWRPSPVAKDCTAELAAIQRSGAHIAFTTFSSSVGLTFAKQLGELKVPAAPVGINVEAQKTGFWSATGGKGEYTVTINTFARVKITDKTIPFYDKYLKTFKEAPNYTAGTYDAVYILRDSIEKAGTIDSAKLVPFVEKTDMIGTSGRVVFDKSHDVKWGPGFVTGLGTQWQGDQNLCIWPYKWHGITYEGTVPYKLPPWVVEHWKKK